MTDGDRGAASNRPAASREPPRSRLRQLLDERPMPDRGWVVPSPSCSEPGSLPWPRLGALLIWHFVRRGRLIRERLSPPRTVRLPEFPAQDIDRPS